jgi:anaerobic magnesium-protoporphyrin IX monomethyl ester cyclase
MRIAFDGSALRPNRTGVGYYSEHLLQHLARTLPERDELMVISNRPIDTTAPLPTRVEVLHESKRLPRLLWMQARVPALLERHHVDVVHFTNGMIPLRRSTATVVTIHDMSLRILPHCHPPRRLVLNRPLMDRAARSADAVITVSAAARRDIVRYYGLPDQRVHVIHEAAAPQFRPVVDSHEIARVRRHYGLPGRIILYVGTVEPRKNLPVLIEAFVERRQRGELDHQLVCVGPYGWLARDVGALVTDSGARHAITFTGYVPFSDLPALYSMAEMFVYPSIYEGFGLPVVEAMACGTPVVAGTADALAEIGAGAIERIKRLDRASLGEAIVRLAQDDGRRRALAAAGLVRARTFSWDRAASHSLDVYRSVVDARRSATTVAASAREFRSSPLATGVDVLFGQSYFLRFDDKLWQAQQPYAPLGALCAAAFVRQQGYRVAFFDAMLAKSEQDWAAALDERHPRVAVLYEDNFNYLTKMCLLRMRQAALEMIAAAVSRGIPIIVAGSDANDHAATYLDAGALAVVRGEGELTLVAVLRAMDEPTSTLEAIDGLCLRGSDGRIVRTPARDIIRDLDRLPFPAWDLVDVERYRRIWRSRHGYFSMNVVTTRGCPFHCNWCAKPIYGQRYTARSPRRVVEELVWLKETYAPDHIWIADDIFGLKPGWVEEFARLVEASDARVPFKCLLRADQVTSAVASALSRAGCQTAWIGAESGSQRVLDAMEKGTCVEDIASATRVLQRVGIRVGFFLQFGYPGETRDDIDKTLAMVQTCRPDDIGVSVSYPLPGTTFYERVRAQLGSKQNWVDSNDLAVMYQATYVPDFYRALHALVHTEFRARQSADALRGLVRQPAALRIRHARAAARFISSWLVLWRLRRNVDHLGRLTPSRPPARPFAVLPPQAAAVPTDQSR